MVIRSIFFTTFGGNGRNPNHQILVGVVSNLSERRSNGAAQHLFGIPQIFLVRLFGAFLLEHEWRNCENNAASVSRHGYRITGSAFHVTPLHGSTGIHRCEFRFHGIPQDLLHRFLVRREVACLVGPNHHGSFIFCGVFPKGCKVATRDLERAARGYEKASLAHGVFASDRCRRLVHALGEGHHVSHSFLDFVDGIQGFVALCGGGGDRVLLLHHGSLQQKNLAFDEIRIVVAFGLQECREGLFQVGFLRLHVLETRIDFPEIVEFPQSFFNVVCAQIILAGNRVIPHGSIFFYLFLEFF
mmetsp:Transcript_19261/g.39609  ORF Transcript_19261/g.39609 Transcript_19261/m.39609 type:complete len:300 (-) Transcript_19261:376-1275(-)